MLRRCRVALNGAPLAPSMPGAALPRQQKFFTGALFSEEINDALFDFARRHGMWSNVWVPARLLDGAVLRDRGVYTLPDARLFDLTALATNARGVGLELENGPGRVVVNASQTSQPDLFIRYGERQQGGAAGAAGAAGLPPVPVTLRSVPFSETTVSRTMLAAQRREGLLSPYWLRCRRRALNVTQFINAQFTVYPGRYNPRWCVAYDPYTMGNQRFPPDVTQRMRERAVVYGYVSRLWVTAHEAATLFGVRLRPERAADCPVIYTSYFTGGLTSVGYYCIDQFDLRRRGAETGAGGQDGEAEEAEEVVVLTSSELRLAATGVRFSRAALRPFPLLHRVHYEDDGGNLRPQHRPSAETLGTGRSGASAADVIPHERMQAATGFLKHIRIFGEATIEREQQTVAAARTLLRQAAVLRDWRSPVFFPATALMRYRLRVLPGETGVVVAVQLRVVRFPELYSDAVCLFNVCQLEEPLVALQLFYRHPRYVFSQLCLGNDTAAACARVQLQRGLRPWWVQEHVLRTASWRVRAGAIGIPFKPVAARSFRQVHQVGGASVFNLDDVLAPPEAVEMLHRYRPVDPTGRAFHKGFGLSMCLRAWERGYTSRRWICLRDPLFRDRFRLRGEGSAEGHRGWRPVRPGVTPLADLGALPTDSPAVRHYNLLFFNEEELEEVPQAGAAPPMTEADWAAAELANFNCKPSASDRQHDGDDEPEEDGGGNGDHHHRGQQQHPRSEGGGGDGPQDKDPRTSPLISAQTMTKMRVRIDLNKRDGSYGHGLLS